MFGLFKRNGFGSLLNGGSSESQEAATTESSGAAVEGGRVVRNAVTVNSPQLAMKVSAWFAGVRILSENAASCLLKFQRWNAAEERFVDTEDAFDKGYSTS
jgi:hypothetical protein